MSNPTVTAGSIIMGTGAWRALAHACSTEQSRPILQSVRFTRTGKGWEAVATDGHILLRYRIAPDASEGHVDLPEGLDGFSVPASWVPNRGKNGTMRLEIRELDGHSVATMQDPRGNPGPTFPVTQDEGYPNYQQILDTFRPGRLDRVGLGTKMNAKLYKALGFAGIESVCFFLGQSDRAIRFEAAMGDRLREWDGVIMPHELPEHLQPEKPYTTEKDDDGPGTITHLKDLLDGRDERISELVKDLEVARSQRVQALLMLESSAKAS